MVVDLPERDDVLSVPSAIVNTEPIKKHDVSPLGRIRVERWLAGKKIGVCKCWITHRRRLADLHTPTVNRFYGHKIFNKDNGDWQL